VSGTCEKIGFTDFTTTHFQCFRQLKIGPNSIFSHVPGTFFLPRNLFSSILGNRHLSLVTALLTGSSSPKEEPTVRTALTVMATCSSISRRLSHTMNPDTR